MAANPDKQNPASPLLWHVAYVKSRSEKKVKERLDRKMETCRRKSTKKIS